MLTASAKNWLTLTAISILLLSAANESFADDDTIDLDNSAAARQLLQTAEQQLANGDADSAFILLSAREAEFAGYPYFDYLLGVAALDTGHVSEAVFSLRRSIAAAPHFSGARMELARAYYESGSHGQARPLFVSLLGENPPAAVRDVLNQYIAAIDSKPARPGSRFDPYIEGGAGFDTNANGSTDSQQFLGFTLNPDNVETDSPFAEIAAGFRYSIPQSSRYGWYSGLRGSYRSNPDASFVDTALISGLGGITWRRNQFFGRAGIDSYWSSRDGKSNQNWIGGDLLLGARVHEQWDLTFGLRSGALRHRDSIDVLDVDRTLATLGVIFRPSPLSSVNFSLISGKDDERAVGSPYGNTKIGARLSIRAPVGSAFALGSIGSLESDFDGTFFGGTRKDTQLTALLQFEFRDVWTDGLALIPRLRFTDNDSDVALYNYDRTEVGLSLRWTPQ